MEGTALRYLFDCCAVALVWFSIMIGALLIGVLDELSNAAYALLAVMIVLTLVARALANRSPKARSRRARAQARAEAQRKLPFMSRTRTQLGLIALVLVVLPVALGVTLVVRRAPFARGHVFRFSVVSGELPAFVYMDGELMGRTKLNVGLDTRSPKIEAYEAAMWPPLNARPIGSQTRGDTIEEEAVWEPWTPSDERDSIWYFRSTTDGSSRAVFLCYRVVSHEGRRMRMLGRDFMDPFHDDFNALRWHTWTFE